MKTNKKSEELNNKLCFSLKKNNNNNQRNCFRKERPIYLPCKKTTSDCCFKKIGMGGEHKKYKPMKHKE